MKGSVVALTLKNTAKNFTILRICKDIFIAYFSTQMIGDKFCGRNWNFGIIELNTRKIIGNIN